MISLCLTGLFANTQFIGLVKLKNLFPTITSNAIGLLHLDWILNKTLVECFNIFLFYKFCLQILSFQIVFKFPVTITDAWAR